MSNRTLQMTAEVYDYLLDVSLRESPVLAELREVTAEHPMVAMQISPEQGQFMALLIRLIGARRCLEIGVYTGYSSLAVASALPEDGKIIACDVNEEFTAIARRFWDKAGVTAKIDLRLAPAMDTLDELLRDGQGGRFDFAFIDADKTSYEGYYERCLELLRPGGLIAVDNVLWSGSLVDERNQDPDCNALRSLNRKLYSDERVDLSMVPIGDGLTLARKRF
ncbi:MAG: class I SAM-dependent methyltransferase [Chromatiales bacterium]|nr:class I SAM-dependent methyltransferase [Chromatiales bacterium]